MDEMLNVFDDSNWIEACEYPKGTLEKVLHEEQGIKTVLLKLSKGFYMNPHSHITAEQHFILKGEYISEGKVYPEGTFQSFQAHETHGPFESRKGALVLVIWYSH
jgi:anti-sigma factor ChrR (cupin superfamily)